MQCLLHLSNCSKSLLLLLLAPLLIPSRHLAVPCSEEREPDVHVSLIMSQLKYQSSAPSHLTKAEVIKPSTLKLNETAQGCRAERQLSSWELNVRLRLKPRFNQTGPRCEAIWLDGLGSVFKEKRCGFGFHNPVSHSWKKFMTPAQVEHDSVDIVSMKSAE